MTATFLDRVVRWNLDLDGAGDIYGDERERLRWYEGITTAASLQWIAVPWVAAILVWPLGRPAVPPLAAVLAALIVPMVLCSVYVRRRRVDTEVHSWSRKRVAVSAAGTVPYLVFLIGALYAYVGPDWPAWRGAIVGGFFGGVFGGVLAAVNMRRQQRRGVAEAPDGDED